MLSASGPIQNAFVGSIARSYWGITSLLFRPPLKAPSDPEKERTSRRARYRADPEKRQRYCHSPERASRSAKRVKVTQRYVVPLQPPSHIKMDYLTCYETTTLSTDLCLDLLTVLWIHIGLDSRATVEKP